MKPTDHIWGISNAQDRVWAQVNGLSPRLAAARLLMVFQAYIDDSVDPDGTFVLAGYIASAESWAKFSADWEDVLPLGVRNKHNRFHFKMSQMAQTPERMARVPAFYRIIEEHVLLAVSIRINTHEMARARNRIWIPMVSIDWGFFMNPYLVAFRSLMDLFHNMRPHLDPVLPPGAKIDFIFDQQSEKGQIIEAWDAYVAGREDEVRQRYGITPRFEDDEEFLPIQAADFWAWWVRKWSKEGNIDKVRNPEFPGWENKRKFPRLHLTCEENDLVQTIKDLIRGNHPVADRPIYDVRFNSIG